MGLTRLLLCVVFCAGLAFGRAAQLRGEARGAHAALVALDARPFQAALNAAVEEAGTNPQYHQVRNLVKDKLKADKLSEEQKGMIRDRLKQIHADGDAVEDEERAGTPGVDPLEDAEADPLFKWHKMRDMGIPRHVILGKMKLAGVDPSQIDQEDDLYEPSGAAASAAPTTADYSSGAARAATATTR